LTFRIVLPDDGFELLSREKVEKLAEDAAYSIQSGASLFVCSFW
jgi:hypothetical protein